MTKIHPVVQWWLSPKLPTEHIFVSNKSKGKKPTLFFKSYLLRYFVHPIKRRIAKHYLMLLKRIFGLEIVAVTGSAGKTTTKEMVASILRQLGNTVASHKNIDPVYNIPTTILKCRPWTKYLVLEFGVEYPGEMEFYFWLAKPDVSVITNIYPTHTEFFGDVKGVAKEKLQASELLRKDSWIVLNKEDKNTSKYYKEPKAKVMWYGNGSRISATNVSVSNDYKTRFRLHFDKKGINLEIGVVGKHYVENSLAAAAVGKILGADLLQIKKGLKSFSIPEHRSSICNHKSGAIIFDDSYNNNPEAAKAALRALNIVSGERFKIVVFGDMLELGESQISYHKELGNYIAKSGVDYLIGVGKASKYTVKKFALAKKDKSFWVKDQSQADKILKPLLKKNTIILIKGSRSIRLDKLVRRLFEK